MIDRRRFNMILVAAAAMGVARGAAAQQAPVAADHPLQASWASWKSRFLDSSGRVIDGFQKDASHSEGQGYGMTMAVTFGDHEAFAAMRDWTEAHLAIRPDPLLAWRWIPGETPQVPDYNNASDGDLFYAWALLRGGRIFGDPGDLGRAQELASALSTTCLVQHPDGSGRLLMLPAIEGFATDNGFIINPSYYMPRAMRDLGEAFGIRSLIDASRDGVALLEEMSATQLMPDWAEITAEGWRPAEGFSDDSGYEAMRVPLFMLWSGLSTHSSVQAMARAHQASDGGPGAATVLDRSTGLVKEHSTYAGYAATPALADCALASSVGSAIPPFTGDQPYYPATLHLMALIAQMEVYPRCVPL